MAPENDASAQPNATLDIRRTDDFTSRYANNVQLEPTLWDVKLTFGQTDQKIGPMTVVQHTAITLSWPEAKVFSYFLRSHVAAHEAQIGGITIFPDIILAPSGEVPPGINTPQQQALFKKAVDAMNKVFREFMQEN
ncbi:MAG: hypothetical protein ACLPOO_19405, partial [Terriglobales bacterium]